MDLRVAVGENVRRERARLGWRQVDLAEAAGMKRATLADVEAGAKRLTLDEAAALCAALSVPLAVLLGGEENAEARRALGL